MNLTQRSYFTKIMFRITEWYYALWSQATISRHWSPCFITHWPLGGPKQSMLLQRTPKMLVVSQALFEDCCILTRASLHYQFMTARLFRAQKCVYPTLHKTVFHEVLRISQLVKYFSAFCGARWFIVVLKQLVPGTDPESHNSKESHSVPLTCILTLLNIRLRHHHLLLHVSPPKRHAHSSTPVSQALPFLLLWSDQPHIWRGDNL
jgi:hypothetical protein